MKHYMKMSQLYAPTLKEDPTEAELASHRGAGKDYREDDRR